ncbi:MAG TPA: hypothetical protein VIK53_09780 [Verrucomicrobiae bacterium]
MKRMFATSRFGWQRDPPGDRHHLQAAPLSVSGPAPGNSDLPGQFPPVSNHYRSGSSDDLGGERGLQECFTLLAPGWRMKIRPTIA